MKNLQKLIYGLVATVVLTSCATPLQSKFSAIHERNFNLTLSLTSGFFNLSFQYQMDQDKIYAKLGQIEIYAYKTNQTYTQLMRMNTTTPWVSEAITEAEFLELSNALVPFEVVNYDAAWFTEVDNTEGQSNLSLQTNYIASFILDPDLREDVVSVFLEIGNESIEIVLNESGGTYSYLYNEFGKTTIILPN